MPPPSNDHRTACPAVRDPSRRVTVRGGDSGDAFPGRDDTGRAEGGVVRRGRADRRRELAVGGLACRALPSRGRSPARASGWLCDGHRSEGPEGSRRPLPRSSLRAPTGALGRRGACIHSRVAVGLVMPSPRRIGQRSSRAYETRRVPARSGSCRPPRSAPRERSRSITSSPSAAGDARGSWIRPAASRALPSASSPPPPHRAPALRRPDGDGPC